MFSIYSNNCSWLRRNEKNLQKATKLYSFINKYNLYGINFLSKRLIQFEKTNSTVALNVLYEKEKKLYPTYISKYNSIVEKNIEWKRLALICINKIVCIIRRNNVNTSHRFLLSELFSFLQNIKWAWLWWKCM